MRSSNYTLRDGVYRSSDPDGTTIRTQNYLCDLSDDDLSIERMVPIQEEPRDNILYPYVRNMEDARLFWANGTWWASGTSREHRVDGTPQIAVDGISCGDDAAVAWGRTYLEGPDLSLCEKNWMPIEGEAMWLYSCYPAATWDEGEGYVERPGPVTPTTFRGGSQLVPVEDGTWLALIHEVEWIPDRHYWHRFVRFGPDFVPTGWSKPFYFHTPGIEFAAGLVEWGDYYVASFGLRDEQALLAFMPLPLVLGSTLFTEN